MTDAAMQDVQALGLSPFGPATFLKAPLGRLSDPLDADVAFIGIPFDQATGFRPGARWGPKALRDISVRMSSMGAGGTGYFDLRSGRDIGRCRVVDCGDLELLPLLWEQDFRIITDAVAAIRGHGALPMIAGGDHSISYPVLAAYAGSEPITVVHIDAHLDYRDDAAGVRYGHGNVMRRVRELPHVEKIISIGIRSLRTRREDVEAHRRDGNEIHPPWTVGSGTIETILPRGRNVYISFDIDALDPAIAPGTGTPEPGGLTYAQVRAIIVGTCQANRIVGIDLVEVAPVFDQAQITALNGLMLLVEAIGAVFGDRG